MNYEIRKYPKMRWYQENPHTTTKSPVLQYLVEGERCEGGVYTNFEIWEDVPLIIGKDS